MREKRLSSSVAFICFILVFGAQFCLIFECKHYLKVRRYMCIRNIMIDIFILVLYMCYQKMSCSTSTT